MDYSTATKLKSLGFPQQHKTHSKYYLTPFYIIEFQTAHDIYMSQNWEQYNVEEEINWTDSLVYIPELIDFIGQQEYEIKLDDAADQWLKNNETKTN